MLQKLLKLQALDRHDIEAVYPMYQHIMNQLSIATHVKQRTDTAVRAAADSPDLRLSNDAQPAGVKQRTDTAVRQPAGGPSLKQSNDTEPAGSAVQSEYLQTLLAMSRKEQLETIRQYLLAATAKDCSLMITVQTLPPTPCMPTMDCPMTNLPGTKTRHAAALNDRSIREIMYKLTVVDLDQKPHAKIRDHYSLNCEVMRCVLTTTPLG